MVEKLLGGVMRCVIKASARDEGILVNYNS